MADPSHIFTLHRYYTWSTLHQKHFDDTVQLFTARGEKFSSNSDEGFAAIAYLSYWYVALNVVVEGWLKLDLHDEKIDQLLSSPNVELLKLYRHNVAHFHEDYFNRPLTKFIEDDGTVAWVRELADELGRWFLEWFDERRQDGLALPESP